jgi:predicted RNA-binding protein with PUA-like domain
MRYFLAKTDPDTYHIDQFEQENTTVWDGVKNPQAIRAIKSMEPGDRVFLYHSGGESRIVGMARVSSPPRPDPADAKSWVMDLEFLSRLEPPTTLAEIKKSGLFNDWALVRQSRLSTMEAPENFVEWMRERYPAFRI